MSPEALRALLSEAHTIAVVGLSPNARRPSHVVAAISETRATASSP